MVGVRGNKPKTMDGWCRKLRKTTREDKEAVEGTKSYSIVDCEECGKRVALPVVIELLITMNVSNIIIRGGKAY